MMVLNEQSLKQAVMMAKDGNADAFCDLYEFYANELYRFAFYMLGNREDAQDAVQDAVLQAYMHINQLKKPEAFKSWLFKILYNCSKSKLNFKAKSQNIIALDDAANYIEDEKTSSFTSSFELYDVLFSLKEDERAIVLLSVISGYKSHEIADILKMPSGSVRSKLSRSLSKLSLILKNPQVNEQTL